MSEARVQVRCVLCGTWWAVTHDRLQSAIRCDRCGTHFRAGTVAPEHPETLLVSPVLPDGTAGRVASLPR